MNATKTTDFIKNLKLTAEKENVILENKEYNLLLLDHLKHLAVGVSQDKIDGFLTIPLSQDADFGGVGAFLPDGDENAVQARVGMLVVATNLIKELVLSEEEQQGLSANRAGAFAIMESTVEIMESISRQLS
ncbi:TPA: hypothetical protein ACQ0F8_001629 [Streptococcus agalactiae]|nr:hypothetical protein [Streptococcus agalactiae]HEO4177361.1 hypothetical protein [Streptococcus agalactiae]